MAERILDMHEEWLQDPAYAEAHAALEFKYAVLEAMLKARAKARLSQRELAERLGVSQAAVAKMESSADPKLSTVTRYAAALGKSCAANPSTPDRIESRLICDEFPKSVRLCRYAKESIPRARRLSAFWTKPWTCRVEPPLPLPFCA